MPWKASSVMEERLRFVARLLDGEAMTDVCRDFGVSRKTGYKIFDRYKEHGLTALSDRSRRPVRYANQLPSQIEGLIVSLKRDKPHWGARKIRELLVRRLDGDAEPEPPHREPGEVEQGIRAGERDAVVGADGLGQAALAEELLEGGDGEVLAGRFERLAEQDEARGVIGDGERVSIGRYRA